MDDSVYDDSEVDSEKDIYDISRGGPRCSRYKLVLQILYQSIDNNVYSKIVDPTE